MSKGRDYDNFRDEHRAEQRATWLKKLCSGSVVDYFLSRTGLPLDENISIVTAIYRTADDLMSVHVKLLSSV